MSKVKVGDTITPKQRYLREPFYLVDVPQDVDMWKSISRADYEDMPCPLCAWKFTDAQMQEIANKINLEFDYHNTLKGWQEDGADEQTIKEEMNNLWWSIAEKVAVSFGMRYYEDFTQEEYDKNLNDFEDFKIDLVMYRYIGSINIAMAFDMSSDVDLDSNEIKNLILAGRNVFTKEHLSKHKLFRSLIAYGDDNVDEVEDNYFVCENKENFDLFQLVVTDRNGKELTIGSKVRWFDPDVNARDLERVWEVYDIAEEVVCIYDEFSGAEVLPNELEVV